MKKRSSILTSVALACSLVLSVSPLTAMANEKQQQAAQGVPVSAITMEPTKIQLTQQLPGRSTAFRVADIRPQVTGIITKRLFTEGGMVEQGQQLYQIDPAPYKAVYDSAKADFLRAQANLASIAAKEARYRELVKVNAVSKQDYDDTKASLLDAKASIAVAEASVSSAEINLNYTNVYAPISGQIGKSNVTEGALVTANQSTVLAKVTQLDPIFVDMQDASKNVIEMRQKAKHTDKVMVQLDLGDSLGTYEHLGTLQFSEVTVDPTTSSVELRAIFPNPEQILFPGLFVRGTLLLDEVEALLIPQRAGIHGQGGSMSAWIIDENNQAKMVSIKAHDAHENSWIVTEGLEAGDKVITAGFQKLRPGTPVQISPDANSKQ